MSTVGEFELRTQERVVEFFQEISYAYLGNWHERPDNRNTEVGCLIRFLTNQGYSQPLITKALDRLAKAATLGGGRTLYAANREVHGLLRYGVKVQDGFSQHVTVALIDWEDPAANDFAIAEEVTVEGNNTKRPDIVLYVNGIAVGVLELKRSTVSVAQGIRQNLDNQKRDFIRPFFTTVQLVMAGNDTEGLRYGVIETPEKYWLHWKEAGSPAPDAPASPLMADLGHLCRPDRLLELIHDFMVFDAGIKKICRHNQYFGVKEAQAYAQRREGGIIWHTQGSGKSLTMVWLAKWIRELKNVDSRVLIVTDRTELDEQIEQVFKGVDEEIHRTESGADLVAVLGDPSKSLICSLIHKFGNSEEGNVDQYVNDLQAHMSSGFQTSGEIFVFVDECHRTQSGKLHKAMKGMLPGATLIVTVQVPPVRSA